MRDVENALFVVLLLTLAIFVIGWALMQGGFIK
jgi:hypothetical protein